MTENAAGFKTKQDDVFGRIASKYDLLCDLFSFGIHRVLKPSGKLVVLEASNISVKLIHRLYLKYMALVMPIIGWLATNGDASAYKYLLRGVESFPTAEVLCAELSEIGFVGISFERLSFGVVAIHVAVKPQ